MDNLVCKNLSQWEVLTGCMKTIINLNDWLSIRLLLSRTMSTFGLDNARTNHDMVNE